MMFSRVVTEKPKISLWLSEEHCQKSKMSDIQAILELEPSVFVCEPLSCIVLRVKNKKSPKLSNSGKKDRATQSIPPGKNELS